MDDRRPRPRHALALLACLGFSLPAAVPVLAAEGGAEPIAPEFSLHGFSDVRLQLTRTRPGAGVETKDDAFALGQFDLYMVSRLSDEISFLGEAVIETNAEGATVVDLERAMVRMSWSEALRLSAGRTHTALGWWNEAYHHGALLQPMVDRPLALRFEDDGGLLPVHAVGAELSGQFQLPSHWNVSYVGNVCNGRGAIPDQVQTGADLNRHKATALKLSMAREGEGEFRFGMSGYLDHIPADPSVPERAGEIREQIGGAHARVKLPAAELLGEAFLVKHDDSVSGATFRQRTGYAVLVLGSGRWRPYAAWDRIDAAEGDPFYGPGLTDLTAAIGGLRFDVHPFESIRLEFRHETYPGGDSDGLVVQTAFSF
jgi:hypothetical protein